MTTEYQNYEFCQSGSYYGECFNMHFKMEEVKTFMMGMFKCQSYSSIATVN